MAEHPGNVAKADEAEALAIAEEKVALQTVAAVIGAYYSALRSERVPASLAAELVVAWHADRLGLGGRQCECDG